MKDRFSHRRFTHHVARTSLIVVLLLGATSLVGNAAVGDEQQASVHPPPPPSLTVTGEATIQRAADLASVTFSTEGRASRSAEASRIADRAASAAMTSLKDLGVPADAILTRGYGVDAERSWDDGKSKIRGYLARHVLEMRLDDLKLLGTALDAIVTAGASIESVRFEVKDRAAIEQEVLSLAMERAVQRARTLTSAAGVGIGDVLRIEHHFTRGDFTRASAGADATGQGAAQIRFTGVSFGTSEAQFEARVTLEVAIRQAAGASAR